MQINFIAILVAALVPVLTGFVWYSPMAMGNIWMREAEMTEEKIKNSNMILILVLCVFLSFLLSFILQSSVIHQFGAIGMIGGDVEHAKESYKLFMSDYGTAFRTFKHGALHGTLMGLFFVLPIVGINSLFERKSAKYVALHVAYWTITLALMGGILCGWQ